MENWEQAAYSFINSLSASSPTPGGGAAAAVSAAMGCALCEMMCGISSNSEFVSESSRIFLGKMRPEAAEIKQKLMCRISEDAHAFEEYLKATKSQDIPPEKRSEAVQAALKYAAEVPLDTAILSAAVIDLLRKGRDHFSPRIMSDYYAAETLLVAAIKCSAETVRINLKYIKNKEIADSIRKRLSTVLTKID